MLNPNYPQYSFVHYMLCNKVFILMHNGKHISRYQYICERPWSGSIVERWRVRLSLRCVYVPLNAYCSVLHVYLSVLHELNVCICVQDCTYTPTDNRWKLALCIRLLYTVADLNKAINVMNLFVNLSIKHGPKIPEV